MSIVSVYKVRVYRFLESDWYMAESDNVDFMGNPKEPDLKSWDGDMRDSYRKVYNLVNMYDEVEAVEGINTMLVFRKAYGGNYRYYNINDLLNTKVVEDVTVQVNRDKKLDDLGI